VDVVVGVSWLPTVDRPFPVGDRSFAKVDGDGG
jgi:hypothetical protein